MRIFYFISISRLSNISSLCSSVNSEEDTTNGDNDDNDEDNDDNIEVRDDNKDAMPPKEVRLAATAKKPATATAMTLPTPRPLANLSIDFTNKFAITNYCKGTQDYADMVIHVNRVIQESEYRVRDSHDRTSIS